MKMRNRNVPKVLLVEDDKVALERIREKLEKEQFNVQHCVSANEALFKLGLIKTEDPIDIFNVGSAVEFSVGELVELCGEAIGECVKIESIPSRRRKYDRPNQLADITHIKTKCGWAPKRNLRQALEEIWQTESVLQAHK